VFYTQGVIGSSPLPPTIASNYTQSNTGIPPNTTKSADLDPLTINFPLNDFFQDIFQNVRKVPQRPLAAPDYALKLGQEFVFAMTLEEAVKIYAICARAENKSERTVEWVTGAAKRLAAFAGSSSIEIADIDTNLIRRFILSLDEQPAFTNHPFNKPRTRPVSPETKSNYVRGLKSLFSRLLQEGYISNNPMARIKTPKVPTREPVILSESEISRLFSVMDKSTPKGFRDYAIFLTLLDSGMKPNSFCPATAGSSPLLVRP